MKEQEIKILELFGGIGAPKKALINLGIPHKSIDYVEIDEKAVKTYNRIFKEHLNYKSQNISNWDLKPNILVHGSPCQDFSIAGKQKGADEGTNTRSSLMWETLRIIKNMGVWKPKIVIWENVKNILSKHMRKNFDKYIREMEKLGYSSSFAVLNAMDFGIPQKRERVFTVSILGDEKFDFNKLEKKTPQKLEKFLTDKYEEHHIVKQRTILSKLENCEISSSFQGRIKILQDFCYTITTKQMRCPNAGVIKLKNGKYRYLTELECWRLMGFDDEDFYKALAEHPGKKGCHNGTLYKQAGNSIVVPILEEIFKVALNIKEQK